MRIHTNRRTNARTYKYACAYIYIYIHVRDKRCIRSSYWYVKKYLAGPIIYSRHGMLNDQELVIYLKYLVDG